MVSCFWILQSSLSSTNRNSIPFWPLQITMTWVAIPASGTAILVPETALLATTVLMFCAVGASNCSVMASVPMHSPVTSFGSKYCFISSLANLIIASVNRYTEDEKGTGASDRPSSSATTQSSRWPSPKPSYCSGILIPVHPMATICCQRSVSNASCWLRTLRLRCRDCSFSRNLRASD